MEVVVVEQPETVVGVPEQMDPLTVNNNDSVVNTKDLVILNENIKETIDSSNNSSEVSPFGPWMLVRRNPRTRGRPNFSTINDNKIISNKGSRFSSLMEKAENEEEVLQDTEEVNVNVAHQDSNINKGNALGTGKKANKGRTNQGNKGPSIIKPKQSIKGPVLNISPINNKIEPKETKESSTPAPISDEERKLLRDKEKLILHNMKLLEQCGINGLDLISTHVMMPSAETIEFARTRRKLGTGEDGPSKPLDFVSGRALASNMEIDENQASMLRIGKETNSPGTAETSLERHLTS
ncbi:hypothetical protein RIF29_39217 [Crotalaria pallida]|uniref:Uncharacterized protein n=1 Tax=Crotalaria pallida TaxID=3830 RepID=A0AAN9HPL2_CROPI